MRVDKVPKWQAFGFPNVREYMGWLFMNGEETAADEIMANNPEFGQINQFKKVEEQLKTGVVVYEAI